MTRDTAPTVPLVLVTLGCGHGGWLYARYSEEARSHAEHSLCAACAWAIMRAERLQEQAIIGNRDAVAVG